MPRVKKNTDSALAKKPLKKVKAASKSVLKKMPAKTIAKTKTPEKKARPVVIDVIEDDDEEDFFPKFSGLREKSAVEDMSISETEEVGEDNLKDGEDKHVAEEEAVDIDQQKKFYSKLILEREENGDKKEIKIKKNVNLYRRLVWRFIALTGVLLLVVFYFSFSKLTITISPKGESLNDSLLFKVEPAGAVSENADTDFREPVEGTVKELEVSDAKSFSASGEEFIGEEISGKVSLVNNSAKSQALVATTRLLSPDNKLYRIKEAVNIPAGGEVEAEIYVEKPSEDLAIAPTTFTIPGLWLGLQDKIFAKSTEAFVYRQKVKKYIKASDIDQAEKELSDSLLAKSKQGQEVADKKNEVLYETLEPASFEVDAVAGEAKDSFTVKAKSKFLIVSFSKEQIAALIAVKLSLLIPDDKKLVDDSQNTSYAFDNYDAKTGIASIKTNFSATMVLKEDTEIIDKKQLVNLNRDQLENYLKTFPEIKNYELNFFPSFINRAPRLPERIKIEIKGLEK